MYVQVTPWYPLTYRPNVEIRTYLYVQYSTALYVRTVQYSAYCTYVRTPCKSWLAVREPSAPISQIAGLATPPTPLPPPPMEFNGFLDIPRKAVALGNSERFREFSRRFHRNSLHLEVCRIRLNFSRIRHILISGCAGFD